MGYRHGAFRRKDDAGVARPHAAVADRIEEAARFKAVRLEAEGRFRQVDHDANGIGYVVQGEFRFAIELDDDARACIVTGDPRSKGEQGPRLGGNSRRHVQKKTAGKQRCSEQKPARARHQRQQRTTHTNRQRPHLGLSTTFSGNQTAADARLLDAQVDQ